MAPRTLGLLPRTEPSPRPTGVDEQRRVAIITEAERIFGDPEKAKRWLSKPSRAFEGQIPLEMIETDEGAELIKSMLVRIEYGMIG